MRVTSLRELDKDSMAGTVQVLLPMMQSEPEWLSGMQEALQSMSDDSFLKRLPALRGAFHEFSPADRQRVLDVQLELITDRGTQLSLGSLSDEGLVDETAMLAILREADLAGQSAVQAMFPNLVVISSCADQSGPSETIALIRVFHPLQITPFPSPIVGVWSWEYHLNQHRAVARRQEASIICTVKARVRVLVLD